MTNQEILNQIHRGVIVSCQALPDEPLYGYHFMGHLAFAAKEGGAVGIRANTCEDIVDIKKEVDLPVIGIIKSVYDDSDVYITPTMKEIDALAATGVEIIALDATDRPRPNGLDLDTLFKEARAKYPTQTALAMKTASTRRRSALTLSAQRCAATRQRRRARLSRTTICFPASRRS